VLRIFNDQVPGFFQRTLLTLKIHIYLFQSKAFSIEKKYAQPSTELLDRIAMALEVSPDFLMNSTSEDLADSSLTDKELLNQFKMIEKMTEEKKSVVKIFLDAFITKDKIKQLAL
jgi:hypothetical protein